ncbi:unnamed protein product [Dovyalis caffra]|uniref:Zinc finger PHD-type domain-containing protein n=1 Tax=Dovyalis caffra TaxID=77055 RepID=A0AAV1SUC8_9ROSI|nr:unnamed protein product [Dovyalis caffra]
MRKVRFKSMKEVYENSSEVIECKIAPTLNVGYPVKGPSDGKNHIVGLNMGSSVTENIFGSKQYSSDKAHLKEESGTCDNCTNSCSCCMAASLMRMKADVGFSYENSKGKVDDQHSRGGARMLSPKDSARKSRTLSTSEISNLLSACSSHASFSENEESKDTLRASGISENSEMLGEVNDQHTGLPNCGFSSIVLKKCQKHKEWDCFGDDTSCISGSEYTDKIAGDHHGYTDSKNISSSSASIESFPVIENAANVQPALCSLARGQFDTVDNHQPRNSIKFTNESAQAIAVFSNKPHLLHISSARDFYIGANSSKGEPSECSEEQVESPLMRAAAFWVDAQLHDLESHAESVKSEIGRKDGEAAVAKRSHEKEEEPATQAQPVDHDDELDHMEDEVINANAWDSGKIKRVKVCDICGDVGQVEKLATCSKCIDGAEHIYCMREKLDKVPEGNWMCEECMLVDENGKQKKNKFEKENAVQLKESSLNEITKNSKSSGAFNCNISLGSNNEGAGVDKNTRNDSSTCLFPAKRPVDDSEAFTVKRRTPEKSHNPSALSKESCSKAAICWGSSFKDIDEGKMKSTYEGSLLKSKSFDGINSKVELQQSEGGVNKQNLGKGTATCLNKEGFARMWCKSTLFKKASLDHVNAADSKVKKISSNFAHVEETKRLRHGKEENLVISKNTLPNPLMKSPVADNYASAEMRDRRNPLQGEASVLPLSRPKHHDVVDVQGGFGIQRSGRLVSSCDGIQAHISSCASPKVHEIVRKLPQKILAEQASRLVMWPTQLPESQAKEENIALYFFAKDIERGRKINSSQDIPNPQRTCFSELNVPPSGLHNLHSSTHKSGILSPSNIRFNAQRTSDSIISLEVPTLALARMGESCENKVSSPLQKLSHFQSSDEWLSSGGTSKKSEQSSRNVQHNGPSQDNEKKRREKESDPNRVCDIDMVTADEEQEGKRMKSFDGMLKHSSSGDPHFLGYRLPSGAIDVSPVSIKSTQHLVVSRNGESPFESGNPNLELSLGIGKRLAEQGAVSLPPQVGHNRSKDTEDSNEVTSNKNDKFSKFLPLSVASSTSILEQEAKQVIEPKLLFPNVDPSLRLSL